MTRRTISDAELMRAIRSGLGRKTAGFVALAVLVGRKVRIAVALIVALVSGICATELPRPGPEVVASGPQSPPAVSTPPPSVD